MFSPDGTLISASEAPHCGVILQAYTGTAVSHNQHRKKKIGRDFGKNAGEWTRGVEISGEEIIPGSVNSRHSYILTYFRLQRENV